MPATPVLLGSLTLHPVADHFELVAPTVRRALAERPDLTALTRVTAIDPAVSDTPALVDVHHVPAQVCANCVIVGGRRDGQERIAACLVLATTRADVNGVVRRLLDVRKASFLSTERVVEETGMEYGGITALGLPSAWRLLVDSRVLSTPMALLGSGLRRSKIAVPGGVLADFPAAEVIVDLAVNVSG